MLNITNQQYYDEVIAFAKSIGMLEQLQEKLTYLAVYAGEDKTQCSLYKDFAPYSFEFVMKRMHAVRDRICTGCQHKWIEPVRMSENTSNISGEATVYCPKCQARDTLGEPIRQELRFWFNGGLIFHGPHDEGWSIHT